MPETNSITFAFRRPRFPLICDLDGFLIAAESPIALQRSLDSVDLPKEEKVRLVDVRGEGWMLLPNEMIVAPRFAVRRWRKIEIIRLFNGSRNATETGQRYPEHVIANKRLDAIVREIAAILSREVKMEGKGDMIVLKRLQPLKPSRIAERVPENGPPLKDIATEVHRVRRETAEPVRRGSSEGRK